MSEAIASHTVAAQAVDLPLGAQTVPGPVKKDLVEHRKGRLKPALMIVALVLLVAQADYDTAESTWKAAAAQVVASEGAVEQTQAALNQAQINLDYTTIISPTDGVVISRNVDVGQTVAATLQAPTLFVIAEDLRKMQVDTTVAEADVGKPHDGMAAAFTVDAYGSEIFGGVVRQVRNAPQTVAMGRIPSWSTVICTNMTFLSPMLGDQASCRYARSCDARHEPANYSACRDHQDLPDG